MGFQSQSGQLGFKTQAAKGTFLNPGAVAPNDGIFTQITGGGLSANRELINPDPEIGGGRDVTDSVPGPISYSGDVDFYARMESIATLLNAAMGSTSTTSVGTTYGDDLVGTHVITPIDGADLPWLSIEEAVGDGLDVFHLTDGRVNTLSLNCSPDGYLMGSVGLIALHQEAGKTRTASPEWDNTPLLVGTNMTITIGGLTTYCVRDWSFELNNNIEDDAFCLGSSELKDATPKRREITMDMTIRPDDITLWREATYGSAAATTPLDGVAAAKDVNVHVETYAAVGTGVATVFSLDLDFPVCNIQPFAIDPSGDDVIEFDLSLQAIRPDSAVKIVTATVVNGFDEIK